MVIMEKKYNNFLVLFRKDDIIDFYKYGRWSVKSPNIKFDGDVTTLVNNEKLMAKLFKQANPFDYSIEYFLVHISCPSLSSVEVDDIVDIYSLDGEAYKIGFSLSPEIRLSKPLFEKYYIDFQVANSVADAKKGVDNVFAVFDLPQIRPLLKKNELETLIRDSILENPLEGEKSLWYYLLRYERHHSYPKDNRGFFLDMMHAFRDFQKKTDWDDSVINTNLGGLVINEPPEVRYNELLHIVEAQQKFLKCSEKVKKNYYKVAPLFLILKNAFIDGMHEDSLYCNMPLETFVSAMKKYDNDILVRALYLLGITLGRENTYQYIYKKTRIQILK